MPRVVGVDPGTQSFDLCGLADGEVFLEESIDADDARRAPAALVDRLEAARPLDLIAAPSGYGLPLVPVAALDPAQLDLVVLARPEDREQPERVGGLRAMLELMRDRGLPAILLPGVVHLDTVPAHRKVNRVDMGTADKVCVAALGVWDQGRRLGLPPEDDRVRAARAGRLLHRGAGRGGRADRGRDRRQRGRPRVPGARHARRRGRLRARPREEVDALHRRSGLRRRRARPPARGAGRPRGPRPAGAASPGRP